jgi:hypothetical protein
LEHYLCDYMMYGMIDPLFGGALLDHQFVWPGFMLWSQWLKPQCYACA